MSLLSFDLMQTELIYEMQYFDEEKQGVITYEYFYKDLENDGQYILHLVPGTVNEKMIKMSHYLFFECGEGAYYMDEFDFNVLARNAQRQAKCHPMNCKFINYETYRKIEAWK